MIVFFDGICNLCQHSVHYLIQHDKNKTLKFASLQGENAKKMLQLNDVNSLESMVFFDGKELYKKSTAILKLSTVLGGWHKLLLVGYILPQFIRDNLYSFVAKNRYRWFGKKTIVGFLQKIYKIDFWIKNCCSSLLPYMYNKKM